MQKLLMFNQVTLDGYFTGTNDDLSWAHSGRNEDPEWKEFVSGNASSGGTLLFGRKTYEMMESYWPTPQAMQAMPDVAKGMNSMRKVVFSRTLKSVSWNNTTL
ncbi:MAG: dihydrofolate reductase family protein, partial [bacterium]